MQGRSIRCKSVLSPDPGIGWLVSDLWCFSPAIPWRTASEGSTGPMDQVKAFPQTLSAGGRRPAAERAALPGFPCEVLG